MKTYTSREFIKLLNRNGYTELRTKGDHRVYGNGSKRLTISLVNLNQMVARRLIKEYNLKGD